MNNLNKTLSKIQAGKSTFAENEFTQLHNEILEIIKTFITRDNSASLNNIKALSDLLDALVVGEFEHQFMSECDEELFYDLGRKIVDLFKINNENPELAYSYLNLFRHSEFLNKLTDETKWVNLISELIDLSNFNTKKLFEQRVKQYGKKVLFNIIIGERITPFSWNKVNEMVNDYSKALLSILDDHNNKPRVAFLMENSLELAVLDLACLNSGIINVMIPANSVPQHISFILNETKCDFILVSNEKQLSKLKSIKYDVPNLKYGILINGTSAEEWVLSFNDLLNQSKKKENVLEPVELAIKDMATIMYTSGTTGEPKGIIFSQKNIVFKRFCRAIALPEINSKSKFLSYLPLFHTFGRWFELMGSIFWGASYSFMENPSAETMILNMNLIKPTIFISIPKKWLQLYENITSKVDIENDSEEQILESIKQITGGELKWGLSAAGYLSPDVFQFFQKYGVNLMSGFGMTEATGGITMTPPKNYIVNSLGKALPGIELKIAEDGELLVRGEYVMNGYFNQKVEETFDEEGWFPTGDIMKMDANGFIEIIDRKKEIYKNIKGETIAPQRIENLFRDFDEIKQVFVVGDHRPFNTVLIFPNEENQTYSKLDEKHKPEFFSNLVVTINKFLAPFERIVDYKIIDRPFSAEFGELTPKGTYKRRMIEKNFSEIIGEFYKKEFISLYLDEMELRIPNWFLRERGCLTSDIKLENNQIVIAKLEKKLTISKLENRVFRIGDFNYRIKKPFVDLHEFLINPIYWLGNEELIKFTDNAIFQWYRNNLEDKDIIFISGNNSKDKFEATNEELKKIMSAREKSLFGLHLALLLLRSNNLEFGQLGFNYIVLLLQDETQDIYKITKYFLDKPTISNNIEMQKQLLLEAINNSDVSEFKEIFEKYLKLGPQLFDSTVLDNIVNIKKSLEAIDIIDEILNEKIQLFFQKDDIQNSVVPVLLDLLSRFGVRHPTRYEVIRRKLVNVQLLNEWPKVSELAQEYRTKMRNGFRKWLGKNEIVAVDVETGEEYGWADVLIFEEDMNEKEKELLSDVIINSPILREAIFLFSKGNIVRLSNILPNGVWISKKSETSKTIAYRVSVQTRHQGSFEILLSYNPNRTQEEIKSEVNWLVLAGSRYFLTELVEDFGGYWEKWNMWSQKYLPGLNVSQLFARSVKKDIEEAKEKFHSLWPFFIWNAAAAYINFWRLTSMSYQVSNPTPDNFIIPSHDYQLGTRFVSLSNRTQFKSYSDLLFNFYYKFVVPVEEQYPFVKKTSAWKYILPGLINAEGETEGIEILTLFLRELEESNNNEKDEIVYHVKRLIDNINENGYIPKQLFFAIKRFQRWFNLNPNASFSAQAEMLNELFETYNLTELEEKFPETRIRFYLETVFKNSKSDFKLLINELNMLQHEQKINKDDVLKELSRIENEFNLTEKEKFFVARLSYPHLKPSDSASFIHLSVGEEHSANLVVQVEDNEGDPFYIRKPVSPKEISKLYQLFIDANLQVTFKPEHHFIVAISERGFIIGGLFYSYLDKKAVHMEKIVVSNRYRRKGVSEIIMNEFFNRMIDEGFKVVTTGFFRPEYFYRFGFKIEKKYSGLVKSLKKNYKRERKSD